MPFFNAFFLCCSVFIFVCFCFYHRECADNVVTGQGKFEELEVASHEIAASTAQLVRLSDPDRLPCPDARMCARAYVCLCVCALACMSTYCIFLLCISAYTGVTIHVAALSSV